MNVLLRTSHTSRLSSCFNGPSILFKPLQQANIMRQLTPSRSLHTNVLRQARPNSRRPLAIALGLGSLPFLAPGRPISNDSFGTADAAPFSSSAATGAKKDVPVTKGGRLNPAAVRQISFGGLLGLGLGVLFSALSRMLVLVIGLSVVVWQVSYTIVLSADGGVAL